MAPKGARARTSSSHSAKGKSQKQQTINTVRPEIQFLFGLKAILPAKDPGYALREMSKVISNCQAGVKKKDDELVRASCQTIERLCDREASNSWLFAILKADGVDTVAYLSKQGSKELRADAEAALQAVLRRSCEWLDDVDPVDFHEVPQVMYLANALGGVDEDVALSTIASMEKFILHRVDNAVSMLESGALHFFHMILSAHRRPELCHETFQALFRLCDLPGDIFVQHLLNEKGLVLSVVETLNDAPLNMRLQVAGFRLLCLWNQPEIFEPRTEFADMEDATMLKDSVRVLIKEAKASEALRRALADLRNAGLDDQASWLSTLAEGSLREERLKPRVDLLERNVME